MNIKGRKKKTYSNKLFCELCLFYLILVSENQAYLYIINKRFNKSRRTLYRYAEDLFINGITPKIGLCKDIKYSYLCIESLKRQGDFDYIQNHIREHIYNNENLVGSSKQHKNKLFRTSLLILENVLNFYDVGNFEGEPVVLDHRKLVGKTTFAFESFYIPEDLYKKVSLRTKQREIKIAKDVIAFMYEE